jgi:methionyl-tRNA formyltransferase
MRLVFMGTPDFASRALEELLERGHEIAAVYTRAAKPGGRRGLELVPSPVQKLAQDRGLSVFTPRTLRDPAAAETFRSHDAALGVVVAYGLILPRAILEAPLFGCVNLHASLLPRWRGAAPIHRAVMAGDARTGAYVMKLDEGLDTGPVAEPPVSIDIGENDTTGDIHDRLAERGARLLADCVGRLAEGDLSFAPQADAGVCYAQKIEKSERRVDWSRPAREVHDHIRGLSPFPGALAAFGSGEKAEPVKVLRSVLAAGSGAPGEALDDRLTIACGEGAVRLTELQRAGRGALPADAFLRGFPAPAGSFVR